jgi:hypothetical protein
MCGVYAVSFSVSAQDATTTSEEAETEATTTPLAPPPSLDSEERRAMRITEFRTQAAPHIKNRTKNLLENVTNRLNAATSRLERIGTRLESRIVKIEAAGTDGAALRAELAAASARLISAHTALTRVTDLRMDTIVDSPHPRAAFGVLRTELEGVARELTEARNAHIRVLIAMSAQTAPAAMTTATE